jgi:hypothetical protein
MVTERRGRRGLTFVLSRLDATARQVGQVGRLGRLFGACC